MNKKVMFIIIILGLFYSLSIVEASQPQLRLDADGKPLTGTRTKYYLNGKISIEHTFVMGKLESTVQYYSDGKLFREFTIGKDGRTVVLAVFCDPEEYIMMETKWFNSYGIAQNNDGTAAMIGATETDKDGVLLEPVSWEVETVMLYAPCDSVWKQKQTKPQTK